MAAAVQKKYYTVECGNKFAAFDSEDAVSSDDEVVMTNRNTSAVVRTASTSPTSGTSGTLPFSKEAPSAGGPRGGKSGVSSSGRGGGNSTRGISGARGGSAGRKEGGMGGGETNGSPTGGRGGRGGGEFRGRRGGFEGRRGGREDGEGSKVEAGDVSPLGSASHNGGDFRRERGAGRGRGRGGGRLFDRQSQSGTDKGVKELKKGGGGGHNWGNETLDFGAEAADSSPVTPPAAASTEVTSPDAEAEEKNADAEESAEADAPAEEEEEKEVVPVEPETIDLAEYKRQLAAKRTNLPVFTNLKDSADVKLSTDKDLEAEGYQRYVKEHSEEDEEEEEDDTPKGQADDSGRQKKKAVNVYEYIQSEGGRVSRLFGGRGRGGRGGRGRGREEDSRAQRTPKSSFGAKGPGGPEAVRDAPNLGDSRAFPTLG